MKVEIHGSGGATRLGSKRTVLAHIEELDGLSCDDLLELDGRLRADGRDLVFAYDGMAVDV